MSVFTNSLRNSVNLNLNGKGTFKYEKKVIDIPFTNQRIDPLVFSPRT